MKLRRYETADREACLALFDSNVPTFFLESEREDFLQGLEGEPETYFVVEDSGGRVVACGVYLLDPSGREAWITWGMVARERQRQRQGIGSFLVASRLALLCAVGTVRVVHLDTTQRSRGFYERFGFVAERVTKDGYGPGMDRIDLELALTSEACAAIKRLLATPEKTAAPENQGGRAMERRALGALTARAYRPQDLARVVGLIETRLAVGLPWNLSVGDVRQVLPREETEAERCARVWEDERGELVGFGLVWVPWDTLQVLLHPSHDPSQVGDPALCDAVFEWGEGVAADLARERGKAVTLRVRVREGDAGMISVLERRGFGEEEAHTLTYRRSLAAPFDSPAPPPGFVLRHVRGEEEVEAYVALHREAFGTPHMNAASRLRLMRDPGYVAELDLVAEAPDGTLAAFVVGEIMREESRLAGVTIGSTDPVGTRPAYRRMGLARALLLEAFRRLKERGVERVRVSTGSWNGAMQRVLDAVGYEVDYRTLAYAKEIS